MGKTELQNLIREQTPGSERDMWQGNGERARWEGGGVGGSLFSYANNEGLVKLWG